MKIKKMNKQHFLHLSLSIILGAIVGCSSVQTDNSNSALPIKIAGYDYDRVRAIMDGQLSIEGADVSFNVENIYSLNSKAFGPEKKYEVTEIGLIPYLTKYINNDFRDYTLIPVFISRTFRHKNVFVHADSGI